MKKYVGVLVVIALLWGAGIVNAQTSSIVGTAHDLTLNGDIIGSDFSCGYCHGAHGADGQLQLWNRSDPVSTFTLYSSDTLNATVGQPGNASLVCLSCHDGATAFDALNGSPGTSGNDMNNHYSGSSAIIGDDLRNDHPIGISIISDDVEIRDASLIEDTGLPIFDDKVECASCHDAHGVDGYESFLRVDPANSALCLACHDK